MITIPDEVIYFLKKQGFVIVSTINEDKSINSSAKGIVEIKKEGIICIIDLFRGHTFRNLTNNSPISITSVDEHNFVGYTLQGKVISIVSKENISGPIIERWQKLVIERISQRLLRNIKTNTKSKILHPETLFPPPCYLFNIEINNIINLSPGGLRKFIEEK